MMKIELKLWLAAALLFFGFAATQPTFSATHTETHGIAVGIAGNQSVRLILFGFAIGVFAILLVVFKSTIHAVVAKWFYRIFRATATQRKNRHNSNPPLFLHDKTRGMNHTSVSSAPHIAPTLKKTDKQSNHSRI